MKIVVPKEIDFFGGLKFPLVFGQGALLEIFVGTLQQEYFSMENEKTLKKHFEYS